MQQVAQRTATANTHVTLNEISRVLNNYDNR